MPKRLMLAAEIMLDVARTTSDANRALLEAAAAELATRAIAMAAEQGSPIEGSIGKALPPIAGYDHGIDHRASLLVH